MAHANIFITELDAEARVSFTGDNSVALNLAGSKVAYNRDGVPMVAREQVAVFCTVEQARKMLTILLAELEKGEG
jgi:hypothetical protein